MTDAAATTAIEALSANVLDASFEDIDEQTREHAKNRIIDVLGCVVGGSQAAGNASLVEIIKDWGGKEEATILVWGNRVPVQNAAMMNSIMARSLDYEPVNALVHGVTVPAHISGTTVMTAVTLGETKRVTGKELITALLVGDDVASRILAASGYGLTLGWDCTGTVNMFGATSVAGRLLGLDRCQLRNAFGIALNQLAGSFQIIWDATTAFKLLQGLSARNGIFSAQLAKAEWTGPTDPLLARFGYYDLYTEGCVDDKILTKDLGKKFFSDSTFKPYPCCRGGHSAIDCALSLVAKNDIAIDDIDAIALHAPKKDLEVFIGQPFAIGAFPHASAAFNYRYLVSCALMRRTVRPEHFSEEAIRDPRIATLVDKLSLTELPDKSPVRVRLEVTMKSGATLVEAVDVPRGDPAERPLSREDIVEKFRSNVDFSRTITRERSERVLEMLVNLENLKDVSRISQLLVA